MVSFQEALSMAVTAQKTRAHVTDDEIADALGVSRGSVWLYRSNRVNWSGEHFDKLAKVLKLNDPWELFDLAKQEAALAEQQVAA